MSEELRLPSMGPRAGEGRRPAVLPQAPQAALREADCQEAEVPRPARDLGVAQRAVRRGYEGAVDNGEVLGEDSDVVPARSRVGRPVQRDVRAGDGRRRHGLEPALFGKGIRRRARRRDAARAAVENESESAADTQDEPQSKQERGVSRRCAVPGKTPGTGFLYSEAKGKQ